MLQNKQYQERFSNLYCVINKDKEQLNLNLFYHTNKSLTIYLGTMFALSCLLSCAF